MTPPVARLYFAPGFTWQTADASLVWVEIEVAEDDDGLWPDAGIKSKRGRQSLLDQFETGEIDATVVNLGRTFDPEHAGSPYAGDLVPGVPVKLTGQPAGGTEVTAARGTISGFPQHYEGPWATVPIKAYGLSDKLARAKLAASVSDIEALADTPSIYWKLDDGTEAEMLDSSGNDRHGVYDNPELGQDPLVADQGNAVLFAHVGDHRGKINAPVGLPTTFPATLECWIKIPRDLTQIHRILGVQRDTAYGSALELIIETSAGGSPNGEIVFNFRGLGSFWKRRGSTRVDDDEIHHVVLSMTNASTIALYVDGVAQTLTTISGTAGGSWAGHFWWVVGNVLDLKVGDYGAGGVIDNVAIYPTALSAARVLAHYQAGTAPWDGDTTDERLDRVLDTIGLPADRRDFESCTTILGPAVLDVGALDYARLIEASEDGRLFETADGKIRFLDRYWGLTDTHGTTPQAFFVDDHDSTGIFYTASDLILDDEQLVNIATVTREGGAPVTIRDSASTSAYGEASRSVDVLLRTDAESRSLAEHIVFTSATPKLRIPSLRIPLHHLDPADQATMLALEIGYQVEVVRTPQGVGATIDLTLVVEGFADEITPGEWWREVFVSVAPASTDFWIWGTSTWGVSTRWGW